MWGLCGEVQYIKVWCVIVVVQYQKPETQKERQTDWVSFCFGKSCLQASKRRAAMDNLAQKGKFRVCVAQEAKLDN